MPVQSGAVLSGNYRGRCRHRKMGNSSLSYDLAIFKMNSDTAAAQGSFVHVFVDRYTRKSTPIPAEMRDALARFVSV